MFSGGFLVFDFIHVFFSFIMQNLKMFCHHIWQSSFMTSASCDILSLSLLQDYKNKILPYVILVL